MPLSTTSSTKLTYQEEAAFGVMNADDSTHKVRELRFTGESLSFAISKTESAEIRSDRQLTDLIPVSAEASGDVQFELSYKEYDSLIQAVMMGSWAFLATPAEGAGQGTSTPLALATTAPTAGNGGTITGTGMPVLGKGQWFRLSQAGPNNGKVLRTHSTIAPSDTVITLDEATTVAAVAAEAGSTINSARVVNEDTQRQFTFERELEDIAQFFAYRGMTASTMNLKIASGSITSGSFGFMGKDAIRKDGSTNLGTHTLQASETFDVHNGVSGVGHVLEGGSALAGTFIKSIDFTIDNSLRARDAIGTLGSVSIGNGQCKVTGTIEVYLADGTMYDKFLNNITTSIQVSSIDSSGNGYVFQFPAVKYGDAKVNAGGKDQDIMLSIPFTAIRDASVGGTGKTIIIDRVGN